MSTAWDRQGADAALHLYDNQIVANLSDVFSLRDQDTPD